MCDRMKQKDPEESVVLYVQHKSLEQKHEISSWRTSGFQDPLDNNSRGGKKLIFMNTDTQILPSSF